MISLFKISLSFAGIPPTPTSVSKKNSSRRNAWGNLSYADLITKAISSATDSRLTLSQIYEWMVQNVPYFKDKGDSNSSAGWKVSFDKYFCFEKMQSKNLKFFGEECKMFVGKQKIATWGENIVY
jgi:hypothetical protein